MLCGIAVRGRSEAAFCLACLFSLILIGFDRREDVLSVGRIV